LEVAWYNRRRSIIRGIRTKAHRLYQGFHRDNGRVLPVALPTGFFRVRVVGCMTWRVFVVDAFNPRRVTVSR
jgi:hypothetical protein